MKTKKKRGVKPARRRAKKYRKKSNRNTALIAVLVVALLIPVALFARAKFSPQSNGIPGTGNGTGENGVVSPPAIYQNNTPLSEELPEIKVESETITVNTTKAVITVRTNATLQFSLKSDQPNVAKFRDISMTVKKTTYGYKLTLTKALNIPEIAHVVIFYNGKPVKTITVVFNLNPSTIVNDKITIQFENEVNGVVTATTGFVISVKNEKSASTVIKNVILKINDDNVKTVEKLPVYLPGNGVIRIPVEFAYPIAPGVYSATIEVITQHSSFAKEFTLKVLPKYSPEFYIASPAPVVGRKYNTNGTMVFSIISNYKIPSSSIRFGLYLSPAPNFTDNLKYTFPATENTGEKSIEYTAQVPPAVASVLLEYAEKYPSNKVVITLEDDYATYAYYILNAESLKTAFQSTTKEPLISVKELKKGEFVPTPRVKMNNTLAIINYANGLSSVGHPGTTVDFSKIDSIYWSGIGDNGPEAVYYISPLNFNPTVIYSDTKNVYVYVQNFYATPLSIAVQLSGNDNTLYFTIPAHTTRKIVLGSVQTITSVTVTTYIGPKVFITYGQVGKYEKIATFISTCNVDSFDNSTVAQTTIITINDNIIPLDAHGFIRSMTTFILDRPGSNPFVRILAMPVYYKLTGSIPSRVTPINYYWSDGVIAVAYYDTSISEVNIIANAQLSINGKNTGARKIRVDCPETGKNIVSANGVKLFVITRCR